MGPGIAVQVCYLNYMLSIVPLIQQTKLCNKGNILFRQFFKAEMLSHHNATRLNLLFDLTKLPEQDMLNTKKENTQFRIGQILLQIYP